MLTGSDDILVKAWDWGEHSSKCMHRFHTHYIILPLIPKTPTPSCLPASTAQSCIRSQFLDMHEKGVNYVDFYPGADKPLSSHQTTTKPSKFGIISARAARKHVSLAVFYPNLPIIVSGSEARFGTAGLVASKTHSATRYNVHSVSHNGRFVTVSGHHS